MRRGLFFPADCTSLYLAVKIGDKSDSLVVKVKNSPRRPDQSISALDSEGFREVGLGT
jgi:hypothetical protein